MAWLANVCNCMKQYRNVYSSFIQTVIKMAICINEQKINNDSSLKYVQLQIVLLTFQNNSVALRIEQWWWLAHYQTHYWNSFQLCNMYCFLVQRFRSNSWWGIIAQWSDFAHFTLTVSFNSCNTINSVKKNQFLKTLCFHLREESDFRNCWQECM
jgi:hypothetical protein